MSVLVGFESCTKKFRVQHFDFSGHFLKTCLFKVENPIRSFLTSNMCYWSALFPMSLHFVHLCPCRSHVFFVCGRQLCSETGKQLFTKAILLFTTQFLPCFAGKLTRLSLAVLITNGFRNYLFKNSQRHLKNFNVYILLYLIFIILHVLRSCFSVSKAEAHHECEGGALPCSCLALLLHLVKAFCLLFFLGKLEVFYFQCCQSCTFYGVICELKIKAIFM